MNLFQETEHCYKSRFLSIIAQQPFHVPRPSPSLPFSILPHLAAPVNFTLYNTLQPMKAPVSISFTTLLKLSSSLQVFLQQVPYLSLPFILLFHLSKFPFYHQSPGIYISKNTPLPFQPLHQHHSHFNCTANECRCIG